MGISILTLKQGLILFWALWISLVVIHNVFDALKELGILPESWRFVSHNFEGIHELMGKDRMPRGLVGLLFAAVIAWEGFTAYLFWAALLTSTTAIDTGVTITAFAANLALWAAFMLADEAFGGYEVETSHMRIFTTQLVTLLFILLIPGP
jgi:hypothetical protein